MGARAQDLARALGVGRSVFGLVLLLSPRLADRWIGEATQMSGAQVVIRALGARDIALGVGTVLQARSRPQLRRWLVASSACDAVDFAVTLAAPRTPGRAFVLALASGAAVCGLGVAAVI
jgi:uncharacterized protein YjeT (DUF2065 family)